MGVPDGDDQIVPGPKERGIRETPNGRTDVEDGLQWDRGPDLYLIGSRTEEVSLVFHRVSGV